MRVQEVIADLRSGKYDDPGADTPAVLALLEVITQRYDDVAERAKRFKSYEELFGMPVRCGAPPTLTLLPPLALLAPQSLAFGGRPGVVAGSCPLSAQVPTQRGPSALASCVFGARWRSLRAQVSTHADASHLIIKPTNVVPPFAVCRCPTTRTRRTVQRSKAHVCIAMCGNVCMARRCPTTRTLTRRTRSCWCTAASGSSCPSLRRARRAGWAPRARISTPRPCRPR